MKRILLLLIAISGLLCGCNKATAIKPVTSSLTFFAVAEFNDSIYEFTAVTDKSSNLKLTLDSAENMEFSITDDTVKVRFLELEKELDFNTFSPSSPIRVLGEAFKKLKNTDLPLKNKDNQCFADFQIEGERYKLFFGQTGLPLELKCEDNQNSIIFKEVTIK